MGTLHSLALLIASFVAFARAQNGDTVWGAVTVSTFGDRVPLLSPNYSAITSLGAEQMYYAGSLFRDRYISASSGTDEFIINGISTTQIDNTQTYAYTIYEIFVDQGTQAFMAGLYPPLSTTGTNTTVMAAQGETLAGNNTASWPNNGMQYPFIYAMSSNDYMDIYLEGMNNCPVLTESISDYQSSSAFQSMVTSTNNFYQSLSSDFSGALPQDYLYSPWNLSYYNAYDIWDYLSYQNIHDSSSGINASTVNQARYLADAYTWSLYGNGSDPIRTIHTIGGSTLLGFILGNLEKNVDTVGEEYKLTNIFTSYEPLISLFSLLGLDNFSDQFKGMPNLASSISFEMYTNNSVTFPEPSSVPYFPDTADLNVRFLFRNGTTTSSNLSANGLDVYPIFGNGASQQSMSFAAFYNAVSSVMELDVGNWCGACLSDLPFCAAATNGSVGLPPNSITNTGHQLSPVIAGVIGALVALAVAGILFLLSMLIFGVRFRRVKTKRRSELGGFKGSEKLASDPDLPSKGLGDAKSGSVVGATIVPSVADASGHKRVESWELKEGRGGIGGAENMRRPSIDDDEEGKMKGVEAIESV